jgi:hypothetical protein
MANASVNLISLDFDKIKENLKQYLQRSDSPFKDYLYEGSNISQLVDLLSYNSYLQSFYLNMVASEMFLDTAQLRDSVVSHAKELAYVPRSFRSAVAKVSFEVTPSSALGSLLIPKGTTFTSKVGSNTFSFATERNIVVPANTDNNKFYANISIYEGVYTSDTFVIDSSNTSQRFVLSNPTIDIRSITVVVAENNGSNVVNYTQKSSFLGLFSNSEVFFLQAAENSQYEILFGDNVISKRPSTGSLIVVQYRVCNGQLPNGASSFTIDGPIQGQSNISIVATVSEATGGAVNESLESIKLNAPRHYQNQERAVTLSDYISLVKTNFPEVGAVTAFGGEEVEPAQYGKVFVSIDLKTSDGIPEESKKRVYDFLKPRSPVSIIPVIIDPEFLNVEVSTRVRYNINMTTLKDSDIDSIVRSKISQYNLNSLSDFNKTLRFSNLTGLIDNAHSSIVSNDLYLRPYLVIYPDAIEKNNFIVDFKIPLSSKNVVTPEHVAIEVHSIISTNFTYLNKVCFLEDDGNGIINIVTLNNDSTHSKVAKIGTVNYSTGLITITRFSASYTTDGIKIFADTPYRDIDAAKNSIILIKDEDVIVTVEQIRE